MEKKQVQKILQGIFLFVFGLFEIVLLIRILLKLIGASEESAFVKFWYGLSGPIFGPFDVTLADLGSGRIVFEINSIIAMIIYAVIGFFTLKIIYGFFKEKFNERLRNLLDTFFKITEVILGLRVIFKLLGASGSIFLNLLYGLSSPVYEPFKGLLPTFGSENVVFETSTLVAVILIIIMDFLSDKLLNEIFKEDQLVMQPAGRKPEQQVSAGPTAPPQVPMQQPSTINVNIPQTPTAPPSYQPTPTGPQQVQPQQQIAPSQQPVADSTGQQQFTDNQYVAGQQPKREVYQEQQMPQQMGSEPLQPAYPDNPQNDVSQLDQESPSEDTTANDPYGMS
ncbi:YggT family protein [Candidatus Dojkabacteria bacterium]|nr:YggT family protein [Candidatus Dojkabacteria bacterium]